MISNPNVRMVPGRYGLIFYWVNDFVIGDYAATYGEWYESEINAFRLYAKPGDTVLDLGANIGLHTQALASIVGPTGRVVALEPQKPMSMLACANAIVNGYVQVDNYRMAAGSVRQVIECLLPDYYQKQTFGGFQVKPLVEDSPYIRVPIQVVPVDDLVSEHERTTFIKIDVEGSEAEAIRGATETIKRRHPVIYVENDRIAKSQELIELIWSLDYHAYWHLPLAFNPDNYAGSSTILHPLGRYYAQEQLWLRGQACNLVCVPDKSYPLPKDAFEVINSDEHPCHEDSRHARPGNV